MGQLTTVCFVACVCFLATFASVTSYGLGVKTTTTIPPPPQPGHNHNHNHNHGQGHGQNQIHGQNHNHNQNHNHGVHNPNPITPVLPPVNPGRPVVPQGYRTFPGVGSYKFHALGVTWDTAKATCAREGTNMLVINSNAEAEAIKTLFKANPNSPGALNSGHVWIGAQEKGKHGEFITNRGQNLRQAGFLNWSTSPQQPNDPGTNDCVSFYSFGTLYDDPCNIKYPFVCEV